MNQYHLRYFAALAHMEHYTRAAEQLGITQPSLSHAIASLEKELGVKLFEKDGRNIALTKYGKVFLSDVERSLALLDSSVQKLRMTASGDGYIDLAFYDTLCTNLVPAIMKDFIDSEPDKQIAFHLHNNIHSSSDIIEGLKTRTYDIAFCLKPCTDPAIEFVPAARQRMVIIAPSGHPLADRQELHLEDTLAYPHIIFSKQNSLRSVVDKLFLKCQSRPKIAYELDEVTEIAGFVIKSLGIAVLPHIPVLDSMDLKVIPLISPNWERTYYMASLKDSYQAPLIHAFRKFVLAHSAPDYCSLCPEPSSF